MNRQRKVLITITYNEMGIIIDTKAEEVAQPNLQPTCNQLATDTISRQAAIDAVSQALKRTFVEYEDIARTIIGKLPSAQPEIIRCKDCKYSEHWYKDKTRCFLWHETGIDVFEDGYCNYAKRRTDADMRGEQDERSN